MPVLKATRTQFDGPHPPTAPPDPLGKQSLLTQRMVQRLITGLRQYLLANLTRRLSLLPVVLLLHPGGRLRVLFDTVWPLASQMIMAPCPREADSNSSTSNAVR